MSLATGNPLGEREAPSERQVRRESTPNPEETEGTIVCQIVNKDETKRNCQASFTALDPFSPDEDALRAAGLFDSYINSVDFELTLGVINTIVLYHRNLSKAAAISAVFGAFAAIVLCIFVHIAAGISAEVGYIVMVALFQRFNSSLCVSRINSMLVAEVNTALDSSSGTTIVAERVNEGLCITYLRINFLSKNPKEQQPVQPMHELQGVALR